MYSVQWHLIKFVEQKERAREKASDLLKRHISSYYISRALGFLVIPS